MSANIKSSGTGVTVFSQVLILTLIYLFGGGKGTKSLPELIDKHVEDEGRCAAAQAVANRIEEIAAQERSLLASTKRAVLEAMEDHDLRSSVLEPVFIEGDANWARVQRSLLDLRFELKRHLTYEEWEEIFGDYQGRHR